MASVVMNKVFSTVVELVAAHPERIKFILLKEKMPTVAKAAEVLKCQESDIVKTCIVKTDTKLYIAVILQGTDRISQPALKAILGVKKCSFASADEVLTVTGYIAGGTPPIGLGPLVSRILMDQKVLHHPLVIGGGGAQEALIQLSPQTIQELSAAEVVQISEDVC